MKKKSLRDFMEDESFETIEEDELIEILHEVLARLNRIDLKIDALEKKLDNIETLLAREGTKRIREHKQSNNIMEVVMEKLNQQGYLSLSKDLYNLKIRDKLIERMKKIGAVEIDVGNDKYLLHPRSYREFMNRLSEIRTRDPLEAAEKLSNLKPLFIELVNKGLVYFDAKEKKWKML